MGRVASPTVRRRELAARLRELRVAAGMTIDDVAGRLLVSTTKLSRLETAARPASLRDVKDLSDLYRVTADERERLMTLARDSRRRSWWQQYDLPYSTYVGLEAASLSISHYATSIVPGLLQTREYARAVTEGVVPETSADALEQLVEARLTRQDLLTGDQPPRLWTVLDEAVLRRLVGGPAVMHAQLTALVADAARPNVTVQIIPFEAGSHPGMDSTFILLQLEDAVSDVVYVEGLLGHHYLQSPADLDRYRRVFDQLRAVALSPKESATKIASILDTLPTRGQH